MKMIFICYIFVIVIATYSLFILYKYIKFFKKSNKSKDEKLEHSKGLFIAIPCLREQNVIENTIKHFREICDLPIVIITTQKEDFEYEYNKKIITTRMIIEKKVLNKYSDIYLIDYPFTKGYMADQLNFMIEHLSDLKFYDETREWYMSLYNADSKPSKDSFKTIFYYINKNDEVIQQYSYCFKNFDKLNFIVKGFAIYQSNFEIKVGLFNSVLNYKYLYNYVVGHGLTINLKTLKRMGNFNTKFWCEDIYLTMKLKYYNIKISPILELENIENASSVSQIVRQNAVWYDTTKKYRLIYNDIRKEAKNNSFFGFVGYLNEFKCAVNWLFFPIMLLLNFAICFYEKNIFAFLISLFSYLFYALVNYVITLKTINRVNKENYTLNCHNYIYYTIALLISNIGPIYSVIFKKNKKYKTER